MNLFNRIFQGVQKRSKRPKVASVYVFFACPRGGEFDSSRDRMKDIDPDFELRLLENDEFKEYWIKETKKKYGKVKITLFDVDEWDPPELNLWSLEGDLPSIRMGTLLRESVRKALLSRSVPPEEIEKCCELENEDRIYQSHPGLVIWWFKCPKE